MKEKEIIKGKIPNQCVLVESRGDKFVTCPHCWTDQRTERDFCYRCGAGFAYLDEKLTSHAIP